MKKKLAKPLSLLLTVAMVVGVAQTGFPYVYAAEGEDSGEASAKVEPTKGWDGPAGKSDKISESSKQQFSFSFQVTDAQLTELELDVYLGKDGENAGNDKRDYSTAVQFDLEADKNDPIIFDAEAIEASLSSLKPQEIAFYEAAGVKFGYDDGEVTSVDKGSLEKVKKTIFYNAISQKGIWRFSLNTALLLEKGYSDIEFLVAAHAENPDVSWGNNNYVAHGEDTQAYLYTIEKASSGEVFTEQGLQDALNDDSIKTITLANDIEISKENIYLTRPVTIDGKGNMLSFTGLEGISSTANDAVIIGPDAKDSVFQNLTVDAGLDHPEDWGDVSGIYAIHAWNTSNVVLQDVKATGANAGIYVNSSTVTLKGTIDVSGNGFGGVEVSKGKSPEGDLKLTVNGAVRNDSEKYGQPTIWVDGISKEEEAGKWLELKDNIFVSVSEPDKGDKGQTHYYLDSSNAVAPTEVKNEQEFRDALDNEAVKSILLTDSIDISSGRSLEVNRQVAINGDGCTLTFEDLEETSGTVDDGLILYQPVIVKNLIVDAGLQPSTVWVGTYAIHVYNTKDVTLKNVAATGANGGILVNGSEVTLEGTIDVSGNGFVGIDVSKGEGLTSEPKLNASLVDEIYADDVFDISDPEDVECIPAIWVDGIKDIAEAAKLVKLSELEEEEDSEFLPLSVEIGNMRQVQYYSAGNLEGEIYYLTVKSINGTNTFHGSYLLKQDVAIDAGTRSGYTFTGWTVSPSDAGTFVNKSAAKTTFTLKDDVEEKLLSVTVTANWKSNSSSRDDDDSSSGGSSSKPSAGNQDTTGTVTTNPAPGGGTVTTVITQPSSTVVTGGAAQITATVPASAAAAIASATPQSPAQVSISVPTAAVTQQLQNAEVTRASLTITVPPAVANNTNASAQVVVNADAGLLNAARVAGKDLEITIQNAQTGRTAYAWSFSGSALAQATEIRGLNLALSVQSTSSVPAAQSAAPSSAGIVLRFANNGQLPAPATVTVDVSSQGYQPGQVLYFYYLNPNTGRLEAMNNAQPITVNAQGYAAVTVTHNSDFVLLPKKPGSLTLDTVSYTLPKGKAYEIGAKLAGEGATLKVTPSRSGIVKIENTKSGNYKVTGLTNGITYVSFDVYSSGKLVSHSSVKITVQSSGKAQGVAGRRVMNF